MTPMLFRVSLLAAALTAATAAQAQQNIAADVGTVLTMRLYSVGLMDYCYDEIDKRQAFKDASQAWQARNAEAVTAASTLLPKVAKAEEIASLVVQVRNAIAFDLAAEKDQPGACQTAADSLNDVSSDIIARAPDQVARIKAAVAAQ
jgi:hypothetical protein